MTTVDYADDKARLDSRQSSALYCRKPFDDRHVVTYLLRLEVALIVNVICFSLSKRRCAYTTASISQA